MTPKHHQPHRGRIAIIHQILQTASAEPEGVGLSRMICSTALTYHSLKEYLAYLSAKEFIQIREPTKEQKQRRPNIKRYIVALPKSSLFEKLYHESQSNDLVWWEQESSKRNITTTPRPMFQGERQTEREVQERKRNVSKASDKLSVQLF